MSRSLSSALSGSVTNSPVLPLWPSVMVHELQNRITVIKTYASMLPVALGGAGTVDASPPPAPQLAGLVARLTASVEGLEHLAQDLTELAQADDGEVVLQRRVFDVADLCRAVVAQRATAQPGVSVRLDLPEGPVQMQGDLTRLGQVLGNLLLNAGRNTSAGGEVALSLRRDGPQVVLAIHDDGESIPEGHLSLVFNPYYRARGGVKAGPGLGLYVCRLLVEAHGGQIEAESPAEGQGGCTVRVRLPVGRVE